LVRSLKAAVVVESLIAPVLVLCSGEFFIMFISAAAAECSRAADISALSTPADDDDKMGLEWEFPNDDVM